MSDFGCAISIFRTDGRSLEAADHQRVADAVRRVATDCPPTATQRKPFSFELVPCSGRNRVEGLSVTLSEYWFEDLADEQEVDRILAADRPAAIGVLGALRNRLGESAYEIELDCCEW